MHEMPSEVGARAELEVTHALLRAGWQVYLPVFCAHSRVDLVALRPDETMRVQCKTARLLGSTLFFRTCSNTKNIPRSYHGEVDAFGVYSPDLESAYLVPLEGLAHSGCSLRLGPPANNQAKGIRFAAEYLLPNAVKVAAGGGPRNPREPTSAHK
ncbi:MAG TPA: group I intron-associated PD-(D/E)XK endonuclease [Acidimicrobiales bacterium]|nr:group I intron-associated PD-(D/E)XK endonuclease [Acidimicrobiales bacterium]